MFRARKEHVECCKDGARGSIYPHEHKQKTGGCRHWRTVVGLAAGRPPSRRCPGQFRLSYAVCFGTLAQRHEVSAATIRRFLSLARPDCLKVFDVNLRQHFFSARLIEASLGQCDLLKISDEELPVVASLLKISGDERGILLELLRRYNLRQVVLTKGKDGSLFCDGQTFLEIPAFTFGPTLDTVGCGDAFTATLTAGLLSGRAPEIAMRQASRVAGLVCANSGAMPEIPENFRFSSPP